MLFFSILVLIASSIVEIGNTYQIMNSGNFSPIVSLGIPILLILSTLLFKINDNKKGIFITTLSLMALSLGGGISKAKLKLESKKGVILEDLRECPNNVTLANCVYGIKQCDDSNFVKINVCKDSSGNNFQCSYTDKKGKEDCKLTREKEIYEKITTQNKKRQADNERIRKTSIQSATMDDWIYAVLYAFISIISPLITLYAGDQISKRYKQEDTISLKTRIILLEKDLAERTDYINSLESYINQLKETIASYESDKKTSTKASKTESTELKRKIKELRKIYIQNKTYREYLGLEKVDPLDLSTELEVTKRYVNDIKKETLNELIPQKADLSNVIFLTSEAGKKKSS